MSKSAAGSKASTADSKSGQSPTVEMPLSALEAELRAALNKSADEEYMPSESLDTLMMDTIDQIINGTVKAAQLIALLKEIGLKAVETTINSSIVNVLWLYGTQTDPSTEEGRWHTLAMLVKDIAASGCVDTNVMKTSIEFNLLVAAGLMRDESAHQKRLIKINTGLVFKQQKYNLLREETEGYSKLSVMLCNEMPVSGPGDSSAAVTGLMAHFITNVFSVVGHFDLEPNRVLDLILDAFEQQPRNLCFVPLIERFRHASIAHILGFKFTMYHIPRLLKPAEAAVDAVPAASTGGGSAGGAKALPAVAAAPPASVNAGDNYLRAAHDGTTSSDAPQSLYLLAATLIMTNLVDLQDLLPYLRPSLDRLAETLKTLDASLTQQANSYGVVSLNSKASTGGSGALGGNAPTGIAAVHLSADVTKEVGSRPAATSSGRKPPLPPGPAVSSGVTTLPVPPPAVKPPVPTAPTAATGQAGSGVSPRNNSTPALSRVQSSAKLNNAAGGKPSEAPVESEVELSKFALFYDPSNTAPTLPASAVEGGEVAETGKDKVTSDASSSAYAEGNEVLGLICALLALRGWEHAKYLLNLLELEGMDPLLVAHYSPDLRCALAALVSWQLDVVYRRSNVSGAGHGFGHPALSILPVRSSTSPKPAAPSGAPQHPASGEATGTQSVSFKFAAALSLLEGSPFTPQPQLAQVQDLLAFANQVGPLLSYCGYHVREFPGLVAKICRLCRAYVTRVSQQSSSDVSVATAGETDASLEPVLALVCNVLLPALSAQQEFNPFLAGQVWETIRALSFEQRFAVYDRWYGGGLGKEGLGSKHTEVALAEIVVLHGARAELKRLAKENTKLIGRKLARYANTCPLVVFNHVLSQVEAFDNLIPYMVDALKFTTELARDVMAYTLIAQLKKGSTADAKLKKGDTHHSQWFSALTKFIAVFYCRYPTTELKGLFNYLLQRLSIGDSLDLLVLKELLGVMGGCETLLEVSPAQLDGLSGGRALRAEVMGTPAGVVGSKGLISASACRKATTVLRDELVSSQTAIPMLLLLAQVRSRLLHDAESTQLKLISHLYDTAQDVLMQFTEFLVGGAKSLESVAVLMPDVSVLLDEVGLEVPVAFQLVRPLLRAALQCGVDPAAAPAHLKRWHPFGTHLTSVVETLIRPVSMWEHLSPRLYALFWSLGLYDLRVPTERYEAEIKRLKDRYTELDSKKTSTTSASAASLGITAAELSKQNKARDTEMKQLLQKVADLTDDQVKQKKHVEAIREVIRAEQADFLRVAAAPTATEDDVAEAAPKLAPEDVIAACFAQHLLHPRLLMSPIDAVYCTQFCFLLHDMQAPHFSTPLLIDRVLRTIAPLIFCTTEAEASFIGYAVADVLKVVNRWHDCDEATFNAEARDKIGFSYDIGRILPAPAPAAVTPVAEQSPEAAAAPAVTAEGGEAKPVAPVEGAQTMEVEEAEKKGDQVSAGIDQSQFKILCKEWHTRLYHIVRSSLKVPDREYIYIRSGLILLARVSEQFPSRAKEGDQVIALVTQLIAAEKARGDLQVMGKSLLTILKKRADLWLNDSPQRRLAALKAQAKAAALAKAKAEKEAAAAAATVAKSKESAPPSQGTVRGRGAEGGSTGDLRSATTAPNGRPDATGARRAGDRPREGPAASGSAGVPVRSSDSRQDLAGRDRRDQPPAPRDARDRDRDSARDGGRDQPPKDLPPRDAHREPPLPSRDAGRESGRDAPKAKEQGRDRDNTRDAPRDRDGGRDGRDNRAPAGGRDSRDRGSHSLRDNSRERRGSVGNGSGNSQPQQAPSLAGSKRKSDDHTRDDRAKSTNDSFAGQTGRDSGADASAAPPSKVVRRDGGSAGVAQGAGSAKADATGARPAQPQDQSKAPSQTQSSSDRKDRAPEKALTATSNAKVDDGRSPAPVAATPKSKQGTDQEGGNRRNEPARDTGRQDNNGRDGSRPGEDSSKGRSAKDAQKEGAGDAAGGSNKRSRDAAGLGNDAPASTRRATSGGNGGGDGGLSEGKMATADRPPAPNSQAAELLAMKGAAKQSSGGGREGAPTSAVTNVGTTGQAAELLAIKDAARPGRRGDSGASLSSLKAPLPAGDPPGARDGTGGRRTDSTPVPAGSASAARGRPPPPETPLPSSLPGSNSLFPASQQSQSGGRSGGRFDDRSSGAPPLPPGPPPTHQQGGGSRYSGGGGGGGGRQYQNNPAPPPPQQQHPQGSGGHQRNQPPPPHYPPGRGDRHDDYGSSGYGHHQQHQQQGGGNRGGGGGGGNRRQDRR